MPVNSCSDNGKPGYKWGDAGKCYIYTAGDDASMKQAKKKALAQGIAIGDIKVKSMKKVAEDLAEEEAMLATALLAIADKYGKFNEDAEGIWAGYDSPEENDVKDIGVKCENCVLYAGNGICKIIAQQVEPEGKCRFAVIPDGVVDMTSEVEDDDLEDVLKSLKEWFKEKWVDISRPKPGGGFEPCGRPDANTGKYPKCVPASRAARMTPEEIASAVRRKRRAESTQTRQDKKPIYVSTEKAETVNVPTNPELYARVKAEAKAKFDVYPSAYANAWLVREYKRRGGGYKRVKKSDGADQIIKSEEMINGYPAATQDISINIKNRQDCIDIANYGPMNPAIENTEFWQKKADIFKTTIEEAKTARCSNCAAFVQTTKMKEAIATGLGGEEEAYAIAELANLGYCDIFDFKCAGDRTCDAWVVNGPLTDDSMQVTKLDLLRYIIDGLSIDSIDLINKEK